jgi:hypothetical protein
LEGRVEALHDSDRSPAGIAYAGLLSAPALPLVEGAEEGVRARVGDPRARLEQLLDVKHAGRWLFRHYAMNDLGRGEPRHPGCAPAAQQRVIGAALAASLRGEHELVRSEAPPLGRVQDELPDRSSLKRRRRIGRRASLMSWLTGRESKASQVAASSIGSVCGNVY